ncbi:MAG: hypothetical protein LUQ50_04460 [Methanospirillum sp.]|uniref:hypothetical protein n=1 Tax=Methanospirillum sp. TaxID=45200 RepID=UPI00237566CC|nr:hypothetical protein [Methanospirillum sp.]MDD1728308.1 hypothetical protein [Methanospirillum sp.]
MGAFIETVRQGHRFELCGRIIRDDDGLLIFIDGVGRFSIASGIITATLLGLGDCVIQGEIPGSARLSESGRGFYLDIGGVSYVIPVSRVRAVMGGEHRKGPVSRVR